MEFEGPSGATGHKLVQLSCALMFGKFMVEVGGNAPS
jgi:hypothetical protein